MKRHILTLILALVMGVGSAWSETQYDISSVCSTGQTLYYKITNNSTQKVKLTHPSVSTSYPWDGYTKPTGSIIIPDYVEYNGVSYAVTAIDSYAFGAASSYYSCTGLTSVTIPASVKTIGDRAFEYCTGLTTVTIPTSVTSIGSYVFRSCTNLVTVNFNATNCTSIGSETWKSCTKFTTLNLGNGVTRIPTKGFQGATKLVSVTIPNAVTTFGDNAFDGCTSLTTISFGTSSHLSSLGSYAFQDCKKLQNITLPVTLTSIGSYAFNGCSLLPSTISKHILPSQVHSIGECAFQNATALQYLVIPATVTSIGNYAFKGCTSLNRVDYKATNCTRSGTVAQPPFYGCLALATVNTDINVTKLPDCLFKDCFGLSSISISNGPTSIGDSTFYGAANATIILPSSISSIGKNAFANSYDTPQTRIESYHVTPPTLVSAGVFPVGQTIYVPNQSVSAYQNATNWTSYNIVGLNLRFDFSVTDINGKTLFYAITDATQRKVKVVYPNLKNSYYYSGYVEPTGVINIPSTVTYNNQTYTVTAIDADAFHGCSHITQVTIPAGITAIQTSAFSGCLSLAIVNFNATNCTQMGSSASPVFAGCTALTTLNIGTNVSIIPAYAFKNCTHLNCNLVFPNTMTTIGVEAFYNCSAMISQLNFPDAVTSIGDKAFYGCANLIGNLRIGASVTTIGASTFQGCTGLSGSLSLYENLVSIGASAFQGCSGLSGTLSIPNSVTTIGNAAFKGCSDFTNLSLGGSLNTIGDNAFENCTAMASDLVLPNAVATVGSEAFKASGITGITIPGTVSSIGVAAFKNCASLAQITIQNANISESEFEACTALASVAIPSCVTTMGANAFKGCTGLNTITFQNEIIGESAFYGCTDLTQVTLPVTISTVSDKAFYGCSNVEMVSIPNSVTSIGASVFENCTSLTEAVINSQIIGSKQFKGCTGLTEFTLPGQIISVGDYAFMNCTALATFNYNANNCTTMGSTNAPVLSGCTALSRMNVGANVQTIPNYTFKGCSSLSEIHSAPMTAPVFTGYDTQYGFADVPQSIPVYVPCNKASQYQNATYWNHFSNYIEDYPFDVTVNVNSSLMGSAAVTQMPSCDNNGQAIVSASANQDYFFINWTENGVEVSTNAVYSFTPTDYTNLVANFAEAEITVAATAEPTDGGVVTGSGTYSYGTNVMLTATANTNFVFVNWTENGNEVSTNPFYSFTAQSNRNLVANFAEFTNHWTPSMSQFEDNMTLTCIVQFDGVEQRSTALEIGAFSGTDCRGAQRATYFAPTDRYIFQMLVYGEANETISFKLYDHDQSAELNLTAPSPVLFTTNGYGNLINPYVLNFTSTVSITATANPAEAGQISGAGEYPVGEIATLSATANNGYQFLNWSVNGTVVSTSATYQFEVAGAADYVANFCYKHTQTLAGGWNWWSSYIELSNINGLTMLENSLGNHGMLIKSRANGYVEAYEFGGTTEWYGTLNSICNEQMYKVRTNATCEAVITGNAAVGENHPITISNGWNWIGYTNRQSMDLDEALGNINPEANDVIKGRTGFSTYYSTGGYNMWYGTLNTLEPGQGYMYFSNSQEQKSLVYSSGRSEAKPNITSESNVFQPNDRGFADNMNITAVVEIENEELRSENYEVAAFVNGECRGSVKLLYVEPTDSYVAFLTVFGEDGENLEFRLTDGNSVMASTDKMSYTVDGVIGSLTAPAVLHFNMTGVMDNGEQTVSLYPNPTNGLVNIECEGMKRITVIDAFGQSVYDYETSGSAKEQINMTRFASGVYMVRVYTDNGIINKQFLKE